MPAAVLPVPRIMARKRMARVCPNARVRHPAAFIRYEAGCGRKGSRRSYSRDRAKTMTSAPSTARAGDMAVAPGVPASASVVLALSGSRTPNTIAWPSVANARPRPLPTLPAPMIAIRMVIPLLLEPPRLHHGRYWDPMETARLRRLATPDLTAVEVATIRSIMDDAFGSDENERF